VVVGAGTAGCAVAARLAEDPQVSVALLEAGHAPPRILSIPLVGLWAWLRQPARFCWEDWTVPQPELAGRRIWWPAGRLVGGSSAINAMVYNRGHPLSYRRWDPAGATDWNYESLLPYFRRAEDNERGASTFHGVGGPLGISETRNPYELARAFIAGCQEVGIPATDDFNAAEPNGAGFYQLTQRRGVRTSTADYLSRAPGGPRVTLFLGARAARVLFDKQRAMAVQYQAAGETRVLRAAREVILCAGVVRSPRLLLSSGIGPAPMLRRFGIPVIAESPSVGVGLQDQLRVPVAFVLDRPRPTRFSALLSAGVKYLSSRRGLLASNVCEAAAILPPDPPHSTSSLRIACRWRVLPERSETLVDFEVALLEPQSRGVLGFESGDPFAAPSLDPGYLAEPADREALQHGIELARRIAASASCRAAGVGAEFLPGAIGTLEHLRRHADTAFHPVGTCRFGTDAEAVVDPQLRVRGVDGLRIVDASVLPATVAGNAQAAVLAVAERAADLIRGIGLPAAGC
jgi:choline dehydrogenase